MDMERVSSGICGTVALVFGIYVAVTKRVQFGDVVDEAQMWIYGWRAVAVGLMMLALAALFFASALGFIRLDEI